MREPDRCLDQGRVREVSGAHHTRRGWVRQADRCLDRGRGKGVPRAHHTQRDWVRQADRSLDRGRGKGVSRAHHTHRDLVQEPDRCLVQGRGKGVSRAHHTHREFVRQADRCLAHGRGKGVSRAHHTLRVWMREPDRCLDRGRDTGLSKAQLVQRALENLTNVSIMAVDTVFKRGIQYNFNNKSEYISQVVSRGLGRRATISDLNLFILFSKVPKREAVLRKLRIKLLGLRRGTALFCCRHCKLYFRIFLTTLTPLHYLPFSNSRMRSFSIHPNQFFIIFYYLCTDLMAQAHELRSLHAHTIKAFGEVW